MALSVKTYTHGVSRSFTLRNVLIMILGQRPTWMSKRLGPAMGIANAGIWMSNELLWEGDLDFWAHYRALERVAEAFEVTFCVKREGGKVVWMSNDPENWHDYPFDDLAQPCKITDAYPKCQEYAKQQQEQWAIDHGFKKKRRTQCAPKSKSSKTKKNPFRSASSRRASSKSARA